MVAYRRHVFICKEKKTAGAREFVVTFISTAILLNVMLAFFSASCAFYRHRVRP